MGSEWVVWTRCGSTYPGGGGRGCHNLPLPIGGDLWDGSEKKIGRKWGKASHIISLLFWGHFIQAQLPIRGSVGRLGAANPVLCQKFGGDPGYPVSPILHHLSCCRGGGFWRFGPVKKNKYRNLCGRMRPTSSSFPSGVTSPGLKCVGMGVAPAGHNPEDWRPLRGGHGKIAGRAAQPNGWTHAHPPDHTHPSGGDRSANAWVPFEGLGWCLGT